LTTLAIAGWRIAIDCAPTWAEERVRDAYRPFLVPDGGAASITLSVTVGQSTGTVNWDEGPTTSKGIISRLDMPGVCGRINHESWQASLALKDENSFWALDYLVKRICAYRALDDGGLLFHSAGLLVEGKVYLFTGHSGAGKSTLVTLSSQALALNDELVLLRQIGGTWRAYGTPFWNDDAVCREGQTADGPVAGIYVLVQDQDVFLEPLNSAIASSELVANCPVVNADSLTIPYLLRRCRSLAEMMGVQRLHFRKDPDFWHLLVPVTGTADGGAVILPENSADRA
jgi:hypothetical protein